jgi:hypothetical protein
MHLLIFILLVLWVSFCFAKLEISIEGENGWADKLPTWRLSKEHFLSRLLAGGRELTGYHVWVHIYNLSLMHLTFLFVPWSLSIELQLFSFLFALWIVEDFFWFLLNPAFGLKKFKKEYIWWHERGWWWFAPKDYFIFLPISAFLYWLSFAII